MVDFAWLIWSLLLLAVWAAVYCWLRRSESRREMISVSLWTSLLGLTEPLFVPEYWNPPSLFDLARRTGFDLESLLFSFGIGGLAFVLYELIFQLRHAPGSVVERRHPRHRFHPWVLLAAPMLFAALLLSPLNPIYAAIIAMAVGGALTWYCRPDLKAKMLASGGLFLAIYFVYFLTLVAAFPGYVERVWNLPAVSGLLVLGVPLEELLFALSFGFLWSSVFEHFTWKTFTSV